MRIGILSDVHGNYEALEVVLQALKDECIDCTYCLGDLVGYGPDPNPCVEKVMDFVDKTVVGNHDVAAIGHIPTSEFNIYASMAIDWTRGVLDSESIRSLNELPFLLIEEDVTLVHATPEAPDEWDYILSIVDAQRSFGALKTQLCFVGHTHVPEIFIREEDGRISNYNAGELEFEVSKKYIINVGSVGQPRDGDPRASYGILDTDERRFRLNRVSYPIDTVQEKMVKVNLPEYLIERLSYGK